MNEERVQEIVREELQRILNERAARTREMKVGDSHKTLLKIDPNRSLKDALLLE